MGGAPMVTPNVRLAEQDQSSNNLVTLFSPALPMLRRLRGALLLSSTTLTLANFTAITARLLSAL